MRTRNNRNTITGMKAASQADRFPAALHDAYFKVDERSTADLVHFASKYAGFITYYNSLNRADGDWTAFFEKEPAVILLLIKAYKVDGLKKKYGINFRKLNHAGNPGYRQQLLWNMVHETIPVLEDIAMYAEGVESLTAFSTFFSGLITLRLSKVLQTFIYIEDKLVPPGAKHRSRAQYEKQFSSDWFAYAFEPPVIQTTDRREELNKYTRRMDEQMHSLFHSLEELQAEAASCYKQFIENSGNIQPHIGLLLTFFDLLQFAQERINNITPRHLEYYYGELLGMQKLPAVYGESFAVFKLSDGMPPQEIKQGTLLLADGGTGEEPLHYAVKYPFIVNGGTINTLIGIECNHALQEPGRVFEKNVPAKHCYQAGPGTLPPYAKSIQTQPVGLGFAISDRLLLQREGDRRFSVLLTFTPYSFAAFREACITEIMRLRFEGTVEYLDDEPEDYLEQLLRGNFEISCSVEEGWYTADPQKTFVTFPENLKNTLQFDVLLESTEPAITAVTDPQYAAALEQQLPVFRFGLRNTGSVAYTLFRHLIIETITVDLAVTGARQLKMRNDYGPVTNDSPFDIFGPLPGLRSGFFLGHEALALPLYDLCVTIEWMNHASHENGFGSYYKGYEYVRDNSTYKVALSALHTRRWLPTENKQVFDLFQNVPEGTGKPEAVSRITRFNNFDLVNLELHQKRELIRDMGPFPEAATAGFLRFELCYPPTGFGHSEYPQLVNKVTQEMVLRKNKMPVLPSEPYTPSVKQVLLDFKTRHQLDFRRDDCLFYEINPYNAEQHDDPGDELRPVPWYADGSTLLIGLTGIGEHETLSLLVKLNDVVSAGTVNYPEMRWSIMRHNRWVPLAHEMIIADETENFCRTGIIRFGFGELTPSALPFYSNCPLWLRLESTNGFPFIALFEDLHTQAAAIYLHSGVPLKGMLPAGSLKALVQHNAAIESVVQPYASHGDKPAEDHEAWLTRISERLRHRHRALSLWDFEHLVLQEFPEVHMVKCIAHHDKNHNLAPGEVLLAVLPAIEGADDLSRKGRFTQEKLDIIRGWLQPLTSEHVTINVVNPVYEKLKVKLRVRFNKGYDETYYLRKLNSDIREFLDPWRPGSGIEARFGVSVNGFIILDFVEKLPYVDYITNFNVLQVIDGSVANLQQLADGDPEIIPTTAISILVSDNDHIIRPVDETSSDKDGINELIVGTDFVIDSRQQLRTGTGINFSRVGKTFVVGGTEAAPENVPDEPVITVLKMKIS